MSTCLGLDLGSNSIGWALVNPETGQIINVGVRIFPEGVARDTKGGEVSKNETRRVARGMRRQTTRRRKRKMHLKRLFVERGLLPEVVLKPRQDVERIAWEKQVFEKATPYALRKKALDEKLVPHELGRALLHLCQRRGFLSNRKADKAARKEESAMLLEISELEQEIQASGSRTLGEFLAGLSDEEALARIRGRHTRRAMYRKEFEAIWQAQKPYHAGLLTDELHNRIEKIIFYQRPLKIPKSLIGTCELIPNRRRCPRADRRAQRFRMLQEVNNLLLIDENGEERPLIEAERADLLEYLAKYDRRSFAQIKKKLGFSTQVCFNLERGDRKSLYGMPTDKAMAHKDLFGPAWHKMDDEARNKIVRDMLEKEENEVLRLATGEWGLSKPQAEKLLSVELQKGYAAFSREAITRLLPHLERGLPLMTSDSRPCAITEAGFLRPDQRQVEWRETLPPSPDLATPIVNAALRDVRKVVNAVIREHGRPDEIHVELAREVKGSARQRAEYTKKSRQREKARDDAAAAIREIGVSVSRDAINRYLLWKEQDRECVYSGRAISLNQLLSGEVDMDHVLPKSRSLDDSLMNKVICFRNANHDKGNRTPYEWLAETAPERFEEIRLRAKKLPYGKYRKFLQKEVVLDNFIGRQLNDTAYISRAVRQYLECLVEKPSRDMLATKGQLTAKIRYEWGLNTILRDDGLNLKTREDHRHHAIDAIVTALIDRSRLQTLAREDRVPEPCEDFRRQVEQCVNTIQVSHRVRRKANGQLHDETVYGRTGENGWFVARKPLKGMKALTLAEVEHIRDDTVQRKVIERLKQFGIKPGRKKKGAGSAGKIPDEVWAKPLWMNEEKKIPIRKVRVRKTDQTIQPIRNSAAFVKPGNTHHLCIFEMPGGKRDAVFVTMLEAARRAKTDKPIIRREHPDQPNAKFIMSLSGGELVLANWKGQERILQFRTAASTQGQIYLSDPRDARKASEKEKFVCTANTLQARKITIDPLGRIRWASD